MKETLAAIKKQDRRDPGPEFWDGYWTRLEQRLEREEEGLKAAPARRSWPARIFAVFPKWAYQGAAAVVLIAVGVFIGRIAFMPPRPQIEATRVSGTEVQQASGQAGPWMRAQNYLQRSKLILLALVNFDPASEDAYGLDLPRQKQVSRELVNEAAFLKNELKEPGQARLRELVSDLETILIQIANLESEQDLTAVEFVKQGVESRGVLLKINVSEMGEGAPKDSQKPESLKKGLNKQTSSI